MTDQPATQATELDKTRRYLVPVASTPIADGPEETHWSVYEWLPKFTEWATGMSLCGQSMRQGPLPEGTAVSCSGCEAYRPRYERMLAPGYRPEDDDPEALRRRLAVAERQVAAAYAYAEELRGYCSPHGVSAWYAQDLERALDRAKNLGQDGTGAGR